jgi:hypothetical protein
MKTFSNIDLSHCILWNVMAFLMSLSYCLFFPQYAAVYVKKHLIESLVAKIKVLKLLTQKSRLSRQAVVKTAERLCPGSVTKTMLDHIGMPLSEYKQVNPESILFRSESSNCHNGSGTKTINGSLVLSSRIKPLEEVPIPKV